MSFDYDRWLESPYTDASEPCEHECSECEGTGKLWLEETERFSDTDLCEVCKGEGKCDGDCEPDDPPEYEPYDDE
jgi:DnaJ-class molecular chaperone